LGIGFGFHDVEIAMTDHTVTRTLETELAPDRIIKVLSDPALIPQWTPGFADRVESNPEGGWQVI
jgi:hypothetical protein